MAQQESYHYARLFQDNTGKGLLSSSTYRCNHENCGSDHLGCILNRPPNRPESSISGRNTPTSISDNAYSSSTANSGPSSYTAMSDEQELRVASSSPGRRVCFKSGDDQDYSWDSRSDREHTTHDNDSEYENTNEFEIPTDHEAEQNNGLDDEDYASSVEESDDDDLSEDEGHTEMDLGFLARCLLSRNFQPALDVHKHQILKRTLSNLAYVLPSTPSATSCAGTESSGGSAKAEKATKTEQASGNPAVQYKGTTSGDYGESLRRQYQNNHRDEDEEEEDEEEVKRKVPPKKGDMKPNSPKFACPFYQRDPIKYHKHRNCVGPGWDTVHRVKAHIYSRHARPPQCVRCWLCFASDAEHTQHLQAEQTCEKRDRVVVDGMDKSQYTALKSKKRAAGVKTEIDKWKHVYLILFPDDKEVPSPFYSSASAPVRRRSPDSDLFSNFEDFRKRELPDMIEHKLKELLAGNPTVEERFTTNILEAMEECNARLMETWRSKRAESSLTSTPASTQRDLPTEDSSSNFQAPPTAIGNEEARLGSMFVTPHTLPSYSAFDPSVFAPSPYGLPQPMPQSGSRDSSSKRLSQSSTSARQPNSDSVTNYSDVFAGQEGHGATQVSMQGTDPRSLPTSSQSFHLGYGVGGPIPQPHFSGNTQSYPFDAGTLMGTDLATPFMASPAMIFPNNPFAHGPASDMKSPDCFPAGDPQMPNFQVSHSWGYPPVSSYSTAQYPQNSMSPMYYSTENNTSPTPIRNTALPKKQFDEDGVGSENGRPRKKRQNTKDGS